MKRIIFVDDDENILEGLRRMLRSIRKDWDMTFINNAEEALEIMDKGPAFDIVVSDINMPVMDGIEFLTLVRERYPQTVRFGLSGQADSSVHLQAANIVHQFISKPCEPQRLHNLIVRTFTLHDHLNDEHLRKTLLHIGSLPSLPVLYQEIMNEIQSPDPSIAKVAELINKDVGISAKVLQLVNSAYSGVRLGISDVTQAASLLGLENLKSIVLMIGTFSTLASEKLPPGFSLDLLWNHSLSVGEFALKIARSETDDKRTRDDSFTSGLLHEIGLLILIAKMPDEFDKVRALVRERKMPLVNAEKEIIGTSHTEVGGYLLDLWGLPDPIVEAITFHKYPSGSACDEFSALTAVHVADYFCHDKGTVSGSQPDVEIDTIYLQRHKLADSIEQWWNVCYECDD